MFQLYFPQYALGQPSASILYVPLYNSNCIYGLFACLLSSECELAEGRPILFAAVFLGYGTDLFKIFESSVPLVIPGNFS